MQHIKTHGENLCAPWQPARTAPRPRRRRQKRPRRPLQLPRHLPPAPTAQGSAAVTTGRLLRLFVPPHPPCPAPTSMWKHSACCQPDRQRARHICRKAHARVPKVVNRVPTAVAERVALPSQEIHLGLGFRVCHRHFRKAKIPAHPAHLGSGHASIIRGVPCSALRCAGPVASRRRAPAPPPRAPPRPPAGRRRSRAALPPAPGTSNTCGAMSGIVQAYIRSVESIPCL